MLAVKNEYSGSSLNRSNVLERCQYVTTGSAGMFRLRRRMRSDFAQHDSGNAANAVKGFLNLAGQVGVDHLENAGCEKCIFREFSQRLSYF
jgi:hypothetical protein